MSPSISPNTQAILLLTAPLIAGRKDCSSELLTAGEYNRLARVLREHQVQPADLLGPDAEKVIQHCKSVVEGERVRLLLGRGFLLSQAIERWQTRAIWVTSRADSHYPRRLKARLKEDAPPLIYGCGDEAILETGGLAVVGSRNVDEALVEYTESIGQLAARSRRTVISGAARGIDQAAMRGALLGGGTVSGVMGDGLERAALTREHRELLMDGRLVLISPYDPAAGFNVGHAMQRNKLIYALADAALVVSSDYEKGGTWTGAVEQLDKLHFVPLYVRNTGEVGRGLEALRKKGAKPWPEPANSDEFSEAMVIQDQTASGLPDQEELGLSVAKEPETTYEIESPSPPSEIVSDKLTASVMTTPAEQLYAKVKELLARMDIPKTEAEIAVELDVSKSQAKEWLRRLVKEGAVEKLSKPARYRSVAMSERLF